MPESIVLDPSAVSTNRTELNINSGPIQVRAEGVDWGNAEIEAVMADQQRGSSPIDYRIPNRNITIPLKIQASGTVSFDQARAKLQKKVALFQQEGGWLKRVVNGGGTLYADVVNAGLTLSGGWMQSQKSLDADAELRLEVLPDFYEDEITLNDHTETTLPELTFTETSVRGDYPARVRIVVDDDQGQNQNTLLWSIRSRHYSGGTTAAMAYEAEALTTLDAATRTSLSGASGGTVVQHASLADDWTPVVGTNMNSGVYLTHTGTYRVFARVYSNGGAPSGGTIQARFVWDVGDLVSPTVNNPWTLPGGNQFYIADLGEIRLDRIPTGTHRWGGQIQAKGQGGTLAVDRLWFLNADDGFGICRGAVSSTGLTSFVARDAFDQSAGTLTGKTAASGGVWAGAGDSDDFSVETTGKTAQRTAVSDSSLFGGRLETVGSSTYANVTSQVSVKFSPTPATTADWLFGPLLRYVDANNWLAVGLGSVYNTFAIPTFGSPNPLLAIIARIGGVNYANREIASSAYLSIAGIWYAVRAQVSSSGDVNAWVAAGTPFSSSPTITSSVWYDSSLSDQTGTVVSALATGGALASGKVGIYDGKVAATAVTRNYDNFLVTTPTVDAAVFASRSAELSQRALLRQDSAGAAYGPISAVTGDLPRLPPAGMDGRTSEVLVKASRGDLDASPDSAIDDISARVYYRPSWLYVPD